MKSTFGILNMLTVRKAGFTVASIFVPALLLCQTIQDWRVQLPGRGTIVDSISRNPEWFAPAAAGKLPIQRITFQPWKTGRWNNGYRTLVLYDSSGAVKGGVYQQWTGTWTNVSKSWGEIDSLNFIRSTLNQTWGGSEWVDASRIITTFTAMWSRAVESLTQIWSGAAWTNSNRTLYTYSGSGDITGLVFQLWTSGSWVNSQKQDDEWTNGNITRQTNSNWVNGAWMFVDETSTSYTSAGLRQEWKHRYWIPDSSKWQEDGWSTYSYAGGIAQIAGYMWYGEKGWIPSGRAVETYSDATYRFLISRLSEDFWYSDNTWRFGSRSAYTYDAEMNLLREVHERFELSAWVYVGRRLYDYGTIISPKEDDLWIAGERDSIRWQDVWKGKTLSIDYSTDFGETFHPVAAGVDGGGCSYSWDIPPELLSLDCTIRITDGTAGGELAASEQFKMKPYLLTRKDATTGDLIAYDIATDRWGFGNTRAEMFPMSWYSQFNYRGIDPFTTKSYPQNDYDRIFQYAVSADFPDWVSFVHAFSSAACYWNLTLGLYSPTAVNFWNAIKGLWGGSCMGIATSNALAFTKKSDFTNAYREFPVFGQPIEVLSSPGTIAPVNELYTYQFGNPHAAWRDLVYYHMKPGETLGALKAMLRQENVPIRVVYIWNNSTNGSEGHAILPFKLERVNDTGLFHLRVYDNSYPQDTLAFIEIDSSAHSGQGDWKYANWPTWGGDWMLGLADPVEGYLTPARLPKVGTRTSPLILDSSEVHFYSRTAASVLIEDSKGNKTGYNRDTLVTGIPGSVPLVAIDGGGPPPYGYKVPSGGYSIAMTGFADSVSRLTLRTGNRMMVVHRREAGTVETDRFFYDGGISVVNPDFVTKPFTLQSLVSRPADERVFLVRSLMLSRGDSVRIGNPDEERLKLTANGTAKTYDLELSQVDGSRLGVFERGGIPIEANSSHLLIPNWTHIDGSVLVILVDRGDDGVVDDTLRLQDAVTGTEQHGSLIPTEYQLYQNYPNPFNPMTTIRYGLPQKSAVHLTVYNLLGQEVATLVNMEEEAGYHEVRFDGSNLASGVYIYRMTAGSFVQSRKFLLLR